MTIIIGEGSENDPASIKLATRKGSFIPNVRRRFERHPSARRAGVQIWQQKHPNIELRSTTQSYNCVGMIFASRRTWVDPSSVQMILDEDEYRKLSEIKEVKVGDVVVYRRDTQEIRHVAIILERKANVADASWEVTVLSQWGGEGEFVHSLDDVPSAYGRPIEYWTDRRSIP